MASEAGHPTLEAPASPDRVLFWGRTYMGHAPFEGALEVISRCCRAAGLERQSQRAVAPGLAELVALQTAPIDQVRRERRLQKVVWHVEARDDRLRLTCDCRMFRGYAVRTIGLAAVVVLAFLASAVLDAVVWIGRLRSLQVLDFLLVIPACFLAIKLIDRLGALGGRHGEALWREVVAGIEMIGGAVEPAGLDTARRFVWSMLGLIGGVLAVGTAWLITSSDGFPWPWAGDLPLLLLGLGAFGIAVLLATLVAMLRYRGFGERSVSLQTGLATAFSAVSLVACPIPVWLLARRVELGARLPPDPELQLVAWLTIAASAVSLGLSLSLFALAVRSAAVVGESVRWQRRHPAWVAAAAAAGDSAVVRRVQAIYCLIWALLGSLLIAGFVLALRTLSEAAFPLPDSTRENPMAATAVLLAAAFGLSSTAPWPATVARAAWVVWAVVGVALPISSVGHLWWSRGSARWRLRRAAADAATASGRRVIDLGRRLVAATSFSQVRFSLLRDPSYGAHAKSFGPLGAERWVVVTSGAAEELDEDELAALIAHEIAHHAAVHPLRDALIRWLARLTLTGDTFGRTLQHSFGYEEEADRRAIDLLAACGFDVAAFGRLLVRLKHVRALSAPEIAEADGDLAMAPEGTEAAPGAAHAASRRAWRERLRLFFAQYAAEGGLHYWHPDYDLRFERAAIAAGPLPDPRASLAAWDL